MIVSRRNGLLAFRLLALFGLCVVLWAGLKPQPLTQHVDHFDKYTHAVGFCGLTLIWCLGFLRQRVSHIAAFMLLLGVAIELAQETWLPARSFDWGDVAMDALGVALALSLLALLRSLRPELPLRL